MALSFRYNRATRLVAKVKLTPPGWIENENRAAKSRHDLERRCMGIVGYSVWDRFTGRSAAAVRDPAMGRGVPRLVPGVLAPARHSLLGGHIRSAGLPTPSRRIAAQGLVPNDRNSRRSGGHRHSDGMVSAKP